MMNYGAKSDFRDNPWWMKTSSGKFTISSAWEEIRQKGQRMEDYVIFGLKEFHIKLLSYCKGYGNIRFQ